MPTGKKIFIDTNILVHANVLHSSFNQDARVALRALPDLYDSYWINRQVTHEYLKVMSLEMRKANRLDYSILRREVNDFLQIMKIAETSDAKIARHLTLMEETSTSGRQIYDANIVTTMLANDVDSILTHNVSDFKRFEHLITLLPPALVPLVGSK